MSRKPGHMLLYTTDISRMSKRRNRGNPRRGQSNDRPNSSRDVYSRGNPRNEPEVFYCPELSLVLPKKYHAQPKEELVNVDGSILEGGGQILRISAALSCILAQPICISKIRACRPKPGLSAQHLAGLRLVTLACEGDLKDAAIRSTEITLSPGCVRSGDFTVDTKTAGSVCLLIQTILPCLLYAPSRSTLLLKGGTDADFAPPVDFFRFTFLHYARMFGMGVSVERVLRGFNPKGCGEVGLSIEPLRCLTPVNITERGQITQITVSVYMCGTLPSSLGERCLHTAQNMAQRRFSETKVPVKTKLIRDDESFGNGWGLSITAETSKGCLLTSTGNGNPKTQPERLASETTEQLIKDIDEGGCVDCHMQDQLIIFMGLADGVSRVRTGPPTLHTKTAIHLVEKLTSAQFTVTKVEDCNLGEQSYVIECKGVGMENVYLTKPESQHVDSVDNVDNVDNKD